MIQKSHSTNNALMLLYKLTEKPGIIVKKEVGKACKFATRRYPCEMPNGIADKCSGYGTYGTI